jgi:hypothetical protein
MTQNGLFAVQITTKPAGAMVKTDNKKFGKSPCTVTWEPGTSPPLIKLMKFMSPTMYYGGRIQLHESDAGGTRHLKLRKIGK